MKNLKFGIIVPFYGVEDYIQKCLESIVSQTYKNFIAILVDDGSKDGSRKIAESYVEKYPDIFMLIEEENQGQGEARNFGFRSLPEDVDYFMFLDSDDAIGPTLLEKANVGLSEGDYDMLTYNDIEMDPKGHIFGTYNLCQNKSGDADSDFIRKNVTTTICVLGRIYSRKFWAEASVEFPKKIWYEDAAIAAYVFSRCKKMYLLNEGLYYYTQREGSVMNSPNCEKMMDIIAALNILKNLFDRDGTFDDFHEELEAYFANCIVNTANRLNMYEKGTKLQKQLTDYIFNIFPDCCDNKYLEPNVLEKLTFMKDGNYRKYYMKYSLRYVVSGIIKDMIPKSLVYSYRDKKYEIHVG